MIETPLTISAPGARLAGTVCVPGGTAHGALVLMIHGSGPLDRDGNMRGQHMDVFNSLARHLAGRGIASLRYDKRGCGQSSGDYFRAGHSDLVTDATSCFDAAVRSNHAQPDQVFVLGHSEGCIIGSELAATRREAAGLVLLCPFIEDFETLLLRQARQVQREIRDRRGPAGFLHRSAARFAGGVRCQQRLIDKLSASSADTFRVGFQRVPARALRELLLLDPPAILRRVRCPTLVVGGEKDLQCDPADAGRAALLVGGTAQSRVIPDLTHVLRCEPGPASILGSSTLLEHPVEPGVLELVSTWINSQIDARR